MKRTAKAQNGESPGADRAGRRTPGDLILGFPIVPLTLALLFLAASLTPSLIPRDAMMQGGLGALVMGIGYMIGHSRVWLWDTLGLPSPRGIVGITLSGLLFLLALVPLLWCLTL